MVGFTEGMDYHLLKRKRKKGHVWYIGILSDMRDANGRRKYAAMQSLQTGDKSLARKRAQAVLNDGTLVASKDNIERFLVDFWTEGESQYLKSKAAEGKTMSPVYVSNCRAAIKRYFLPYFAARSITKLNELNRRNLTEWRDDLFARRKETGISPTTMNKVRQAVAVALEWATDMDMLPVNPMARVRRVAESPVERAIFEREHLVKLFADPWPDFRSYAACMLAVTTGMRLGEIRGLKESALHLEKGYVDVVANWQDREGLKAPKWDSIRYGVPLPLRTVATLKDLAVMNPHKGEDRFVFWSTHHDEPVPKHRLQSDLKARIVAAKIPAAGRTFHSFRHTYVSLMRHSVGADRVMMAVGHTNTATTDGYTHETDEDRAVMAKAAEALLVAPAKAGKA